MVPSHREFILNFIYLFLVALGLRCCMPVFSGSCGESGSFTAAAHRLLACELSSFSAACGIFPDLEPNPWPLNWQAVDHCTTRKSHRDFRVVTPAYLSWQCKSRENEESSITDNEIMLWVEGWHALNSLYLLYAEQKNHMHEWFTLQNWATTVGLKVWGRFPGKYMEETAMRSLHIRTDSSPLIAAIRESLHVAVKTHHSQK